MPMHFWLSVIERRPVTTAGVNAVSLCGLLGGFFFFFSFFSFSFFTMVFTWKLLIV